MCSASTASTAAADQDQAPDKYGPAAGRAPAAIAVGAPFQRSGQPTETGHRMPPARIAQQQVGAVAEEQTEWPGRRVTDPHAVSHLPSCTVRRL